MSEPQPTPIPEKPPCPEQDKVTLLRSINEGITKLNLFLAGSPFGAKVERAITSVYDALCSTIGTVPKGVLDGDTLVQSDVAFSRLTLKVRSMGTNTYIAFGTSATPNFRFSGVGESHTFVAPTVNGTVIPFLGSKIRVLGDGATGVVEVTGIRMEGIVYVLRE